MNGLERMDSPRRWPLMLGLGLIGAIAAGGAGWYYFQRPCDPVQDAAQAAATTEESAKLPATPNAAGTHSTSSGQAAATTEESAKLPATQVAATTDESVKHPVVTGVSPVSVVAVADSLLSAEKKEAAREKYFEALAASPDDRLRTTIEGKLAKLNVEMIRLPWPMPEKQEYVVLANDAIKNIARKYGTTVEMIVKGNELKRPDVIQPGQRLKVYNGKMSVVVSKSRHDLLLSSNGRFFKRYPVATGRYEKTPVGSFVVADRIPEPPWHRDDGKIIPFGDKENILGTRWMAIKATGSTPEIKGYGIHGTSDNASIGKSESAGCIRLKNEDVEELFEMVPIGTPVVIEE